MSLVGRAAKNHPQQVRRLGASDEVDNRETDPALFFSLNDSWRFTIDVAATPDNAKLPRFFTPEMDGLRQSWKDERVWCNPPYSNIRPWVEKAWASEAHLVVMLLPANRTEQTWWQELIEPYRDRAGCPLEVHYLPGRLRFISRGKSKVGANERPPFGCCLVLWRADREIPPDLPLKSTVPFALTQEENNG